MILEEILADETVRVTTIAIVWIICNFLTTKILVSRYDNRAAHEIQEYR